MQAWKGESYDLLSFMYVCGNKIIVIIVIVIIVVKRQNRFLSTKCIGKCQTQNVDHFL